MLASARAGWSAHAPRPGKRDGSRRRARTQSDLRPGTGVGCRVGGRQARVSCRGRSGTALARGGRAAGRRRGAGGGGSAAAGRRPYGGGGGGPVRRRRRRVLLLLAGRTAGGWPEGPGPCCCPGPAPAGWPTAPRWPGRPAAPAGCAAPAAARGRRTPGSPPPSSMPSRPKTEKSTSKVSSQANSVSTKPSAASPTVIHERGKPELEVGEGRQQRPHRRQQEQEERRASRCPPSKPLRLKPKKSSPKLYQGKRAEDQEEQGAAGDDVVRPS